MAAGYATVTKTPGNIYLPPLPEMSKHETDTRHMQERGMEK